MNLKYLIPYLLLSCLSCAVYQKPLPSIASVASVLASPAISDYPAPENGYETLLWGSRDHLINSVFPSLRVFIDKQDPVGNEFVNALPDSEIFAAIKLGLYFWDSILPDLYITFVSDPAVANFKITLKDLTKQGWAGYTNYWTSGPNAEMTLNCVNLAFRSLDFVSPLMSFQYYKAAWDPNKPRWVEYWSGGSTDSGKSYDQQLKEVKEKYQCGDSALERVCLRWASLIENDSEMTALPYYSIFGGKRFMLGIFDLPSVIRHEFGHVLGIGEADANSQTLANTCGSFSTQPVPRFFARLPANDDQINIWIPRAPLRKHPSFGITEKNSPCSHIGNFWGGRGWNDRAIFDRDADALASDLISSSDCKTITQKRGKPFSISYPVIRKGWRIVLQNKTTKEKFYTDNWHVAHEKMAWVLNGNTKAIDCDWFVVDILDEKGKTEE